TKKANRSWRSGLRKTSKRTWRASLGRRRDFGSSSKAGAVEATINKGDAIEVALCWGWIDGQLDKFDDQYFLVRMTPRRPGSRWSAKNREAADRLLVQGRLQSPGRREV